MSLAGYARRRRGTLSGSPRVLKLVVIPWCLTQTGHRSARGGGTTSGAKAIREGIEEIDAY